MTNEVEESSIPAKPVWADSVEIAMVDGDYVATLTGHFPDSCSTLGDVETTVAGDTIMVTVYADSPLVLRPLLRAYRDPSIRPTLDAIMDGTLHRLPLPLPVWRPFAEKAKALLRGPPVHRAIGALALAELNDRSAKPLLETCLRKETDEVRARLGKAVYEAYREHGDNIALDEVAGFAGGIAALDSLHQEIAAREAEIDDLRQGSAPESPVAEPEEVA